MIFMGLRIVGADDCPELNETGQVTAQPKHSPPGASGDPDIGTAFQGGLLHISQSENLEDFG